jgi:hypothetical protein
MPELDPYPTLKALKALKDPQDRPIEVDWLYKTRTELFKWDNHTPLKLPEAAHSAFFGELVKLAQDKLERYQSDLWHDAMIVQQWISEDLLRDGFTCYYTVDTHGTHLSRSLQHCIWSNRKYLYRLALSRTPSGVWELEIYRGHLRPYYTNAPRPLTER